MKASTKARLKIAGGYLSLANSLAGGVGYGALSFLSGNHRHTANSIAWATQCGRRAQEKIKQAEAELAEALESER